MKKSKILAAVLLLAMFSSLFSVATVTLPAQSGSTSAPATESEVFTPDVLGDPMGNKGIMAVNATGNTIIADGALADWDGLIFETFNGVNVSLAFDATFVYVAMQWKDTTNDIEVGQWNKSGMINPALVDWTFLDGADDAIQIGFTNGVDTDIMIWTASNRTNVALAYECNSTGHADGGNLPYQMNTNETGTFDDAKPLYQSNWTLIADEIGLANNTRYDAWHDVFSNTATGSQANTAVAANFNGTVEDYYTVEMVRLLNTGESDDFALDFSTEPTDLYFEIGKANQDGTYDMLISTQSLKVSLSNEAADLTFTSIGTDPMTEALLISGTVFDDYEGYELIVELSGWEDTYGPGAYDLISVNEAVGTYSYLFYYDTWDMPLGDHKVNVTLYPKYDAPIQIYQNVTIDDVVAPVLEGMVDLQARYPEGVPIENAGEDTVISITVGLSDNYDVTDDITAYIYHYQGDDVALKTDLVLFSSGATGFNANLTVKHGFGEVYNYTFFIEAWDLSLNKYTSEYYWFIVASQAPTPAFGIIAGLFGLAAAAFIVKKIKK